MSGCDFAGMYADAKVRFVWVYAVKTRLKQAKKACFLQMICR